MSGAAILHRMLAGKLHRLTVTAADVDYEGSFTIPPDLMQAAGIADGEEVHVWNTTRGTRLTTYAITGRVGHRDVSANGAAAHHMRPGDRVIVATYALVPAALRQDHRPTVIFVDDQNRIRESRPEIAGPLRPVGDGC